MGAESALSQPESDVADSTVLTGAVTRWFEEFATDGILVTDASLTIAGWNRWLETVTGVRAVEVVGRRLTEAFPSLAEVGLDQYYAAALTGEVKMVSHSLHGYIFPARASGASARKRSGAR